MVKFCWKGLEIMTEMFQWLFMMNRSQAPEHTAPEAADGDCHKSGASGQSCVLLPSKSPSTLTEMLSR